MLKPYIAIQSYERDLIVILCSINLLFSFYYLWKAIRLEKVFRLENKNIIKFGKKLGIITIIYIPHVFIIMSLLFRNLHNLEKIMVFLIIIIEILLIGLILKEVYDLLFLEETRRNFELKADRKKYIEK
ncbi:MAG: hypothetical protein JSV62_00720 [Promethearchaeota archaeon]|nr:MAG: hypothetical protein JSV62_00720 [Candidatus Lokiarchaeota archaeon]